MMPISINPRGSGPPVARGIEASRLSERLHQPGLICKIAELTLVFCWILLDKRVIDDAQWDMDRNFIKKKSPQKELENIKKSPMNFL